MFGLSFISSLPKQIAVEQIVKSTTGLLLGAGLGFSPLLLTFQAAEVSANEAATNTTQGQIAAGEVSTQAIEFQPLEDGIYLYGQSPAPEQIGAAYMVFAVAQGDVVGAFYMPHSSFDCFYGNFQADELALTVIDSYEQTHYPFALALEPTDSLATTDGGVAPVGLQGFHAIENPSDNDLRILSTCQANHQI